MKTKPNEHLLTDKAKNAFEYWMRNSEYGNTNYGTNIFHIDGFICDFKKLQPNLQMTIIQEWFDSIGIYIDLEIIPLMNSTPAFKPSILGIKSNYCCYAKREMALEHAIKLANDVYNETKQLNL